MRVEGGVGVDAGIERGVDEPAQGVHVDQDGAVQFGSGARQAGGDGPGPAEQRNGPGAAIVHITAGDDAGARGGVGALLQPGRDDEVRLRLVADDLGPLPVPPPILYLRLYGYSFTKK